MPQGLVTKNFLKLDAAFTKGYTTASEQGSSRSSKTYSNIQWLIKLCWDTAGMTVSVVRKTMPALKRSVYRDFEEIMIDWGLWGLGSMNKSEFVYRFPNGSWIEFFSCEDEQKLRGSKRHVLFVNEANEISFLEWQQLQMRTTLFSIIDYNPSFSDEHWINQVNQEKKTCHWISTYKDNPFLEQKVIDEIESLQWKNKSLWQVYGLGQRAIVEGLVFPNVNVIDYMPWQAEKHRYVGVDYGYEHDPTAIIEVGFYKNGLYLNELCYKTHMLTSDIIRELKGIEWEPEIISESADPRMVDEIYNAGLDIKPVHKFGGSIMAGITKMQEYNIYITKGSVNLIKEFNNYTYRQDKEGKWLNEPIDAYNHCFVGMTPVITDKGNVRIDSIKVGDNILTSSGYKKVTKFFDNGCRKVLHIQLLFTNFALEIEATPEHLFKTKEGWKKFADLKKGDILYLNTSILTEESTLKVRMATIEAPHYPSPSSQGTCGYTTMARYLKNMCASLKTIIVKIRQKRISSAFQLRNYAEGSNIKEKIWKAKNLMEQSIIDTKANATLQEGLRKCTEKFGDSIMEKFLKVATFIIKTVTQVITQSRIWSYGKVTNICTNTPNKTCNQLSILKKPERIWRRRQKQQKNGIVPRKVESGTRSMVKRLLQRLNLSSLFVNSAGNISMLNQQGLTNSVQTTVNRNGDGITTSMTRSECASYAEKSLPSTNTAEMSFAEEAVLCDIVVLNESYKNVYDIEVEEAHEFFANGILVHNCIDATRYVVLEKILGANASGMSASEILGIL